MKQKNSPNKKGQTRFVLGLLGLPYKKNEMLSKHRWVLIADLTSGDILALAVHYQIKTDQGNISDICDAIEIAAYGKITGTSRLRLVQKFDSYAAIMQAGNFDRY